MLLSILISLTAESSYPILGALGRPIQAWFLTEVTRLNPALAQRLHDENGLKPYTVSSLLDSHGRPMSSGSWVKPGQPCLLRITTLTEELSNILLKLAGKKLPNRLTLYKMNFRVDGAYSNPSEHSWAETTSFSEIAQDASYLAAKNKVRLEFVSPTAFRNNGLDISLPLPGQVFRSLWMKWNAFSPTPMQLHDLWPNFANECIFVNELTSINSVRWSFAEGTRGHATGFTGTASFALPRKIDLLEKWQPFYDGASVVLQSLGYFSIYAGVGHHTTIGMGQVRALQGNNKK